MVQEPRRASRLCCIPARVCARLDVEQCTLPDDLAGRLEGKSLAGRFGLLTHSTAGFIDQVSPATSRWSSPMSPTRRSRCGRG